MLLFGFFAFNAGSQQTIVSNENDGEAIGRAVTLTILCCGWGAMAVLVMARIFHRRWSLLLTMNGALAGMVAACGGCNVYLPWHSVPVGIAAGLVYMALITLMEKLKIDDPLDAVAGKFINFPS